MNKKLTPLQALERIKAKDVRVYKTSRESVMAEVEKKYDERLQDIKVIETALEERNRYKRALKIIKNEILDNLTFNDERQQITLEWGLIRPSVKIEGREKYELLKEVLK